MAAAFAIPLNESAAASPRIAAETREQLEFAGVFRGRELTRKDLRLPSGLPLVDSLLDGGIVRGRVSEIIGDLSSGTPTPWLHHSENNISNFFTYSEHDLKTCGDPRAA